MKEKGLFLKAINTFLGAWGGDTPPEAIWGLNNLLGWYSAEYGIPITILFEEDGSNIDEVIKQI